MTAQEKAIELRDKMHMNMYSDGLEDAKRCALVAIEEILNSNPTWFINQIKSTYKYWENVRTALNAL
jgi:hypothetical protein